MEDVEWTPVLALNFDYLSNIKYLPTVPGQRPGYKKKQKKRRAQVPALLSIYMNPTRSLDTEQIVPCHESIRAFC